MKIETVATCPLGSKCEEIKDGKILRCAWSIELAGINPNTGESVPERGCAMAWIPILLIENSQQQRSTSAAVESFRNEMVKANANVLTSSLPMLPGFDPASQSRFHNGMDLIDPPHSHGFK